MTLKKVRPRWALVAGGGRLLQPGEACDNCHSMLGGWVCGGNLCHIGKCSHARMFQQGRAFTYMRHFAGASVYCKHPRSKNYLAEQGALLRGIANHLNAHRQIEIHLRKGMQKAHRLQKKRMIRQRLMVTPPNVDCADAKFSARVRAFAAAPQQIPIPLLTHRLAAPAGYSVPSLGAPTPCMSPGAVYRISNVLAGCVLKSNPSFGMAYVAHLHHVDCCRNVSHRGGCWRYAKQSQPAWVKIDTLGNDLISIAPRFAHKGDLKAPIHATCFRVVANPTTVAMRKKRVGTSSKERALGSTHGEREVTKTVNN